MQQSYFDDVKSVKSHFISNSGINGIEASKMFSRYIITHLSLFGSKFSPIMPTDGNFDAQLINELQEKGCPLKNASQLERYLRQKSLEFRSISCPDFDVSWVPKFYDFLGCNGLQWAVPPKLLEYFKTQLGCNTEIFASPYNRLYDRFYSLFELDKQLGSSGEFFSAPDSDFLEGVFQVNPPFIDAIFTKTTERLLQLLRKSDSELSFIYVMPNWKNFRTVRWVLESEYCVKVVDLKPNEHFYYEYTNGTYVKAKFASVLVILSNTNTIVHKVKYQDIIGLFHNKN